MKKNVLAFDFGASTGRAIVGKYDEGNLILEEIHRFPNEPLMEDGTLYWNLTYLFEQIKIAIRKATEMYHIDSLGIDTWGVDYGLLDADGELIENPVHYRDSRTQGSVEEVAEIVSEQELYELTGNQIMTINTLFQLWVAKKKNPEKMKRAVTLLMTPDLMNYLLTGEKKTEMSIASTSQLLNPTTKEWNWALIERLDLPKGIFTSIVPEGNFLQTIKSELNLPPIPVFNVCSHDTASAVVSVPTQQKCLFVSCGTWSLVGTELDQPIIDNKTKLYNLTNESGINRTTRLLKNITGLWIIQEIKREFNSLGKDYSYSDLEKMAREASRFKCFIDTDDESFLQPGNMIQRVQDFVEKTGQDVPITDGEIVRCVYESLAFKYKTTFLEIMDAVDYKFAQVNMVGGGVQSEILCEMVADSSGLNVFAGPIEATAIGNITVQLMKHGAINSLEEGRSWIKKLFEVKEYKPKDSVLCEQAFASYQKVIKHHLG